MKNIKYFIIVFILLLNIISIYSSSRYTFWQFDFFDSEIFEKLNSNESDKKIKNWTITRSNNGNFISKTIYQFDKNGKEIELLHFQGKASKNPGIIQYKYDDKGELIKYTKDFEGSIDYLKEHLEEEYERKYNENGKIIQLDSNFTRILNDETHKKIEGYETIKYIYDNNKIKEINTTYESTDVFLRNIIEKYDANEKIIEKLIYDKEKKLLGEYYFSYDDKGNLIKEKWIQFNKLYNIKEYEYNNDNKLITLTSYDKREKLDFVVKHEYNENNQLIKTSTYDKRGKCYNINEYQYITNENDEIIQVVKKYGDPKKKNKNENIHEYEYEYWN